MSLCFVHDPFHGLQRSSQCLVVTLSITKDEFIVAASCACQGVWLRRILDTNKGIHRHFSVITIPPSLSIGYEQRNPPPFSVITIPPPLSSNPVMHGKRYHIDVRFFYFLHNFGKERIIELVRCSSQEQQLDIMTKPLKFESSSILRN